MADEREEGGSQDQHRLESVQNDERFDTSPTLLRKVFVGLGVCSKSI